MRCSFHSRKQMANSERKGGERDRGIHSLSTVHPFSLIPSADIGYGPQRVIERIQ